MADALRDSTPVGSMVDAVVEAINKVRSPSFEVGTVLRAPSGNTAVLTGEGWIWIDTQTGHTAPSNPLDPARWHVIYSPEDS